MINPELLRLIKAYDIWKDDAIEIVRIFEILNDDKKVDILDNWPKIAAQIKKHREEIELEKELLLIKTIENIEKDLENYNKQITVNITKSSIKKLKTKNITI